MSKHDVTVTIYCEVFDVDALYASALEHAVNVDKLDRETAEGILTQDNDDETARVPNVAECVRMLIDMGSAPGEGFSIESSDTELTYSDDDDEGQPV